jgi:hypothetical protein
MKRAQHKNLARRSISWKPRCDAWTRRVHLTSICVLYVRQRTAGRAHGQLGADIPRIQRSQEFSDGYFNLCRCIERRSVLLAASNSGCLRFESMHWTSCHECYSLFSSVYEDKSGTERRAWVVSTPPSYSGGLRFDPYPGVIPSIWQVPI